MNIWTEFPFQATLFTVLFLLCVSIVSLFWKTVVASTVYGNVISQYIMVIDFTVYEQQCKQTNYTFLQVTGY